MHRHLRGELSCKAFSRAKRRPLSTSDQPASANTCAAASPKPEVAPVINTTLLVAISFSCAVVPPTIKTPRAGTGPVAGGDVTRCHIVFATGSIRFPRAANDEANNNDMRGQGMKLALQNEVAVSNDEVRQLDRAYVFHSWSMQGNSIRW
jgi:hypothetical protein